MWSCVTNRMKNILILGLLFAFQCLNVQCFTVEGESKLRTKIFENDSYDVKVRPSQTVQVQLIFNLMTINELNTRDQSLQLSGWLTMVWSDSRLSWNTTTYSEVKFIFADQTEIWRPALVISNSVGNIGVIQDLYTPLRIENSGRIVWEPPGIYEVSCSVDITLYPLDIQTCFVTIQSWGYNIMEVNVSTDERHGTGINLQEYQLNGEWDLIGNYTEWDESTDAKGDAYAQLKIFFQMQRKSEYYWLNIILPVLVNSLLTALVFALPAESGEKMGFSLTVLLSFAVLLTLVSDKIPSTSINTSIIVVYFCLVLILGAVAVLLSTIVLNLYFKDINEPIPSYVIFIYKNIIGRVVCYKKCKPRANIVVDLSKDDETIPGRRASTIKRDRYLEREQTMSDLKKPSAIENGCEDELSWQDISKILDGFFLRVYIVTIFVVTMGFLVSLSAS